MISRFCDNAAVIILLFSYNLNQYLAFPNCMIFFHMLSYGLAHHGKNTGFNELRKIVKTLDNLRLQIVYVLIFLGKCLPFEP